MGFIIYFTSSSGSTISTLLVKCVLKGFLRHITGKRVRRNLDGVWVILAMGGVLASSGMQLVATYIGRSQGGVAQWVDLIPIFEVCARGKGCEGMGGGGQRKPWWRQEAPEIMLRTTLEEILWESGKRRSRGYSRQGAGERTYGVDGLAVIYVGTEPGDAHVVIGPRRHNTWGLQLGWGRLQDDY